jgi:hypothetical protein
MRQFAWIITLAETISCVIAIYSSFVTDQTTRKAFSTEAGVNNPISDLCTISEKRIIKFSLAYPSKSSVYPLNLSVHIFGPAKRSRRGNLLESLAFFRLNV